MPIHAPSTRRKFISSCIQYNLNFYLNKNNNPFYNTVILFSPVFQLLSVTYLQKRHIWEFNNLLVNLFKYNSILSLFCFLALFYSFLSFFLFGFHFQHINFLLLFIFCFWFRINKLPTTITSSYPIRLSVSYINKDPCFIYFNSEQLPFLHLIRLS